MKNLSEELAEAIEARNEALNNIEKWQDKEPMFDAQVRALNLIIYDLRLRISRDRKRQRTNRLGSPKENS